MLSMLMVLCLLDVHLTIVIIISVFPYSLFLSD